MLVGVEDWWRYSKASEIKKKTKLYLKI